MKKKKIKFVLSKMCGGGISSPHARGYIMFAASEKVRKEIQDKLFKTFEEAERFVVGLGIEKERLAGLAEGKFVVLESEKITMERSEKR